LRLRRDHDDDGRVASLLFSDDHLSLLVEQNLDASEQLFDGFLLCRVHPRDEGTQFG
jgi:hypothetical protein